MHLGRQAKVGGTLVATLLAACGATGPGASLQSPGTATLTPVSTASSRPAPNPSPSPSLSGLRLVIEDLLDSEVRLARLDATDTATIKGQYDGIVDGQVIVLNGSTLQALNRSGSVKKLGQLAASPDWYGAGTVIVKPDLSQWLYVITDTNRTTRIHLGTSIGDRIVATLPSPDGEIAYVPFAWNDSGIYMTKQPTGLGGAGPFLEYHFALARFDLANAQVTDVSPTCIAYQVLDDGTMICRPSNDYGLIEVRSPSGKDNVIRLSSDRNGYIAVAVSPDNKRLIAGRNGSKGVINYQMVVADSTSSSGKAFGPLDYLPDTWLLDGRVVANHVCAGGGFGGGPCNAGLDGAYFFSPDGTSHTPFFKLTRGTVVGYV